MNNITPPNIPDEAALTQLANSFFALLPNPAGSISSPVASTVETRPPEAPRGTPVAAAGTPSVSDQSAGGTAQPRNLADPATSLGLDAFIVTPPQLDILPSPASLPSSPYYFLGEASPYQSVPNQDTQPLQNKPIDEDRVTARSFGLPGEDELRQLLTEIIGTKTAIPKTDTVIAPGTATPSTPTHGYYFLDALSRESGNGLPTEKFGAAHPPFDVNTLRRDFPTLSERINGRPLIWFDNAATTQKPQGVIDRLAYFYTHENSNIHRAAHELAARATDAYEGARSKVARFLGAASANEIIFVRGATEAINLVAQAYGSQNIHAGDEIILSELEHHANIVPWQQLATNKGAKIRVIPVDDSGQILLNEYQHLLSDRTKLVAITQVSNALGTVTPVNEIVELAHRYGARVLVDGAQAVSHMRVNVQAMDADFYAFSGHKVFAPTGIGVLYGKEQLLNEMPPWQGGGNMITDVTFERSLYQKTPARFEAGTGNIADAAGLGAAIDYLERIGLENVARYEHDLLGYAMRRMEKIPGLRLIGTATDKASVLSFVLAGYRPEDVGTALNREGIAVRAGHHCAQPILRRFGLEATVRPSLAFYNTCDEVDTMIAVLQRLTSSQRGLA